MKKRVWGLIFILAAAASAFGQVPSSTPSDDLAVDALLAGMKKAFAEKDAAGFLAPFAPGLREKESAVLDSFFAVWKMDRVLFHKSSGLLEGEGGPTIYLQVLYENVYAAMLETWQVGLARDGNGWRIATKEVTGNLAALYKLRLPSGRVEKAEFVEVRHEDIVLTFRDVWVFYDNLPDTETALIVLGPGRVRFAPSTDIERHQLELRYKTPVLEEKVEDVYLRFSKSTFESNITIRKAAGTGQPTPVETARAAALFRKHYPSSFTIENSLTGERLSFLPQSEQVVFEIRTSGRGDFTYIYTPFSDEEIHFLRRNPDQIINLYSPAKAGETGRRMFVSFGQKFVVRRCDVDVDFQPERFHLSAKATVEVAARLDAVDSLKLDLNPAFEILRVYDAERRELFYTQDKARRLLYIYFLKPLAKDAQTSVEILYRGVLEPPVQTADTLAAGQSGEKISLIRPGFESYLYSQSASWYPASPEDDFFLSRMRIIVPPDYVCVANGTFVEESKLDSIRRVTALDKMGHSVYTFETRVPVKYLAFIAGRFDRTYDGPADAQQPPLKLLISEDIRGQRKGTLDEARAILQAFASWFGPFPFEKLTLVQRIWPTSGGHSPASFVVLNEQPRQPDVTFISSDSPVDLSRYREYYLAHEIAHQWWGQGVTGGTYHDQWMSEGLAQFAAVRFIRSRYGEKAYAAILKKFAQWTDRKSRFGPISLGSRLSVIDFPAFQAIVYNKACLALCLLSELVGEEVFDRGVRDFFAAFKGRSARTVQFVQALEKATGRDLRPFFAGWFESDALPDVFVTHAVDRDGDGYVLRVKVHQPVANFIFPLVATWTENGRPVRRTLAVDQPTKEFTFRSTARPAKFKVNPEGIIPGRFTD